MLISFVMTIPGTALTVGFNAMFAEAVPVDWRAQVFGLRQAIFAIVMSVVSLISGQILGRLEFPYGYMVVFAVGVIGAATTANVTRITRVGAVATVQVAAAIALEATLSFLGLGLPITEPSLGLLIANGYQYLLSGKYWISFYPGLALLLTIVAINLVADQLRDILNPRLRK